MFGASLGGFGLKASGGSNTWRRHLHKPSLNPALGPYRILSSKGSVLCFEAHIPKITSSVQSRETIYHFCLPSLRTSGFGLKLLGLGEDQFRLGA